MNQPDQNESGVLEPGQLAVPLEALAECQICPRMCKADRRSDKLGYCLSDDGYAISLIFSHLGEEPLLSGVNGICNIFFDHCNMQCVYCQNHQISRNSIDHTKNRMTLEEVVEGIEQQLQLGAHGVGFVSPSHYVPQMMTIIKALRGRGHDPVFVYNSNGYDRVEIIRQLDSYIDVFLPDFKYSDEALALNLSDTPHYVESAQAALKQMFAQRGSEIVLNENGTIESGMIIRHLVLPGRVENSLGVLSFIAEELSPDLHLSIMAQYSPNRLVGAEPGLNRNLRRAEYEQVLEEFDRLGFYRGFVQSLDSPASYHPDFSKKIPFE